MGYRNQLWTSANPQPGCLVFTDKNFPDRGFLEVGNFGVPLMWSMCFSGSDVNVCRIPEDDAPEPDVPCYGASCDTRREAAVERLERRLPSLARIVHSTHHEACGLFVARMRESSEPFVHMNITVLLENADDPSDGTWKKLWCELLDGLDQPVVGVRTGILRALFGLGLPSSWKYMSYKALDRQGLSHMTSPQLELWCLTGEGSIEDLRKWQA